MHSNEGFERKQRRRVLNMPRAMSYQQAKKASEKGRRRVQYRRLLQKLGVA